MKLTDFKDKFGLPGEGVHKQRIYGFALVDIIGTFIFALILWIILLYSPLKEILPFFITGTLFYLLLGLDKLDLNEKYKYWLGLLVLNIILYKLFSKNLLLFSIIFMFSAGIYMHAIFNVDTKLNNIIKNL
jgi:hypothetical protein